MHSLGSIQHHTAVCLLCICILCMHKIKENNKSPDTYFTLSITADAKSFCISKHT